MSNMNAEDSVSQLAAQSDAAGRLAQDSGGFAAVVAAFEAKDPGAFRWVLDRLDMLPHCELICEWVLTKLGVLRCIEVCGPAREGEEIPDLQQFARAIVQLASNEEQLRRVVEAVSCGNADQYRAAIEELKLEAFCHLLCRWVFSIVYRRVCEIVCTPEFVPLSDAVRDIRAIAKVLDRVVANNAILDAIGRAAVTLNCETLRSAIDQGGFAGDCEIICSVVCSWRCAWVCLELCRRPVPILTGAYAIEEARNFALASRQLANQPRVLGDLVAAVQNRDAKAYGAIIDRFGLAAYCEQVCAWVCSTVCIEFCRCVCPSPALQPLFTTIGYFDIFTDIDAAGTTNKGLPFPSLAYGGGPNFAFYGQLQLGGFCPAKSWLSPSIGVKYRFLYDTGSGPTPIANNLVSTVPSGATRTISWPSESLAGKGALPMNTLHLPVWIGTPPASVPATPVPPAIGSTYVAPTPFYIQPDANGWVTVDPAADEPGFTVLLGFDTTKVALLAGGNPLLSGAAIGDPGGVPAGSPVPAAEQRVGTDVSITFEATRVTTFPPGTTADYNQAPAKIRVNNWSEVNNLWFLEFGTNCCTPINESLSVQYTVDHEQLAAGAWSLGISSCSPSAPGDITPRPTTLAAAISASQTSITVTTSAGFPPAPFNVAVSGTGEVMTVTAVAATTWTVLRAQQGTAAAAAAAGAGAALWIAPGRGAFGTIVEDTKTWALCSYTVALFTRPGLTTGLTDDLGTPNTLTFCICGH